MICKKDVIIWFKDLESYRRIDMMCTLLNMCLPFELRFLGTCLEELGRRDSQELRGIELRVNNPQDLAADMIACQKGEPTDKKIRRKMALYLALIRACNRSCVTELFRTLDEWGDREFRKMDDLDTLQELLLVYTMAANHPVFSYEQHVKCTDIFKKIKQNKLVCNELVSSVHQNIDKTTDPIFAQGIINVNFPSGTKILPSDGPTQHQIALDGLSHILGSNIGIPTEIAQSHCNSWPTRSNSHQCTTLSPSTIEIQLQQSSSPLLSQQSTPASSRAASPNRSVSNTIILKHVQSHQKSIYPIQNISYTNSSQNKHQSSSTPPPVGYVTQDLCNEQSAAEKIQQIDNVINTDGSTTQLQTIIRNGFGRNSHQQFMSPKCMQPPMAYCHALSTTNLTINTALRYPMQSLSLVGKSGLHSSDMTSNTNYTHPEESDSESSVSSSGGISPPETPSGIPSHAFSTQDAIRANEQYQLNLQKPTLGIFNKQINLDRVCGQPETTKIYTNSSIQNLHQQPSDQYIGTDLILTPSLGTTSSCMMQSSLSNNNAICITSNNIGTISGIPIPSVNAISSNSNIGKPMLITSTTTGSSDLTGNIINSNSVIPSQQQHSTSYPYHVAASHHIGSVTRPPMLHHTTGIGPTHSSYRLPNIQMQANGEIIYPTYHPGGLTFLSSSVTSSTANHNIRFSSNHPTSLTTQGTSSDLLQQKSILPSASSNILVSSSYSSLTLGVNKHMSCYNCGSQTHIGRDCQEASMDDVSRNGIYKLDYSICTTHASPITVSQTKFNNSSTFDNSNKVVNENGSDKNYQQKQHIITTFDIGNVSSNK